jgi:hypothetical protein
MQASLNTTAKGKQADRLQHLCLPFDRALGGSWFFVDCDLLRTRMDGTVLDHLPGSYRTRSVSREYPAGASSSNHRSMQADGDVSDFGTMTERRAGTRKSHRPLFPPAVFLRPHVRVPTFEYLFVSVLSQGLAFSVKKGVAVPPSLRNMYKELENEYPGEFKAPKHG